MWQPGNAARFAFAEKLREMLQTAAKSIELVNSKKRQLGPFAPSAITASKAHG